LFGFVDQPGGAPSRLWRACGSLRATGSHRWFSGGIAATRLGQMGPQSGGWGKRLCAAAIARLLINRAGDGLIFGEGIIGEFDQGEGIAIEAVVIHVVQARGANGAAALGGLMDEPMVHEPGHYGGTGELGGIEGIRAGIKILSQPPKSEGKISNLKKLVDPRSAGINNGNPTGALEDKIDTLGGGFGDGADGLAVIEFEIEDQGGDFEIDIAQDAEEVIHLGDGIFARVKDMIGHEDAADALTFGEVEVEPGVLIGPGDTGAHGDELNAGQVGRDEIEIDFFLTIGGGVEFRKIDTKSEGRIRHVRNLSLNRGDQGPGRWRRGLGGTRVDYPAR